jgi:hypothetical protein
MQSLRNKVYFKVLGQVGRKLTENIHNEVTLKAERLIFGQTLDQFEFKWSLLTESNGSKSV